MRGMWSEREAVKEGPKVVVLIRKTNVHMMNKPKPRGGKRKNGRKK